MQKKKLFGHFTPFMSRSFQIREYFFSLFFPKDFKKKRKEHWTLESGGKKMFKQSEQMKEKKSVKNFLAAAILHPL